ATRGDPHVVRRDVAPPAVVEAEEHERRELDRDHERDDLPVEQVPVEDRCRLVEAQEERQPPGGDDQDGIEENLPRPVSVHREAHVYAASRVTTGRALTRASRPTRLPPAA